ncbi:hypothetical protein CYMTET_50946 [Cymbomonas tetramitiformis]|uniref:Uncharacterized protein n=1 Tax=Cymbomonas tetramitiformis TaxID=36881 RepID=A0AAE0ESX5_9CHLO|nr:hypothetical protein CYMTET_50946 [Cymbomonas tetramitiformis]
MSHCWSVFLPLYTQGEYSPDGCVRPWRMLTLTTAILLWAVAGVMGAILEESPRWLHLNGKPEQVPHGNRAVI